MKSDLFEALKVLEEWEKHPRKLSKLDASAMRTLRRAASVSGTKKDAGIETLTCRSCNKTFERVITRGRKPTKCGEC